jgi:hypothetical protein
MLEWTISSADFLRQNVAHGGPDAYPEDCSALAHEPLRKHTLAQEIGRQVRLSGKDEKAAN